MSARLFSRFVLRTGVAALFLASALGAGAQVWTGAGEDDLRYRLSVIDAELADIRARLGVTGGVAPSASGGGDVVVRLNQLQAELQRLTGRLEKIEFEQRRIAEEAAQRFSDIEFRLTELEGGDTSNLAPIPPLGGKGASPGAAPGGGTAVAATPEVSVSERADLDRAVRDVQKGRFDLAEDRLRTFLTSYPGSPLESDAYYWLGESQFVRGAFPEAARSYLAGYKAQGQAEMRARNLYRLGVTLSRLGQINEACLTLREVTRQFPQLPEDVRSGTEAETQRLNCG